MQPAGEMYHGAFAVDVPRVRQLLLLFPPHGKPSQPSGVGSAHRASGDAGVVMCPWRGLE